jgi:hypothetical protein
LVLILDSLPRFCWWMQVSIVSSPSDSTSPNQQEHCKTIVLSGFECVDYLSPWCISQSMELWLESGPLYFMVIGLKISHLALNNLLNTRKGEAKQSSYCLYQLMCAWLSQVRESGEAVIHRIWHHTCSGSPSGFHRINCSWNWKAVADNYQVRISGRPMSRPVPAKWYTIYTLSFSVFLSMTAILVYPTGFPGPNHSWWGRTPGKFAGSWSASGSIWIPC